VKRRDVIIVALSGDKPRPAVVVQSDDLIDSGTVLICPFTSGLKFAAPHRVVVESTAANGLNSASVLMTEKLQAVRRDRCGPTVGTMDPSDMSAVNAKLAFALGLSLSD